MQSPEITGYYRCPACGNTRAFIGYDDRGYPGPDQCKCAQDVCTCEETLIQHFAVHEDGQMHYQAFEGGGCGAEIGEYTRIQCAACGHVIWSECPNADAGQVTQSPPDHP